MSGLSRGRVMTEAVCWSDSITRFRAELSSGRYEEIESESGGLYL